MAKSITLEVRKKISNSLKGRRPYIMTDEIRKKISESKKGKPSWNKGIPWSEEMKVKLSIAHKNQKSPFKGKERPEIQGINHPMWGKINIGSAGEKNHNWKGGITSLVIKIRNSIKMKLWRLEIFERDDFTCQKCGLRGGKLNADHIKEFSIIFSENKIESLKDAMSCLELWDINNGQTLCRKCHNEKTRSFLKVNWKNQHAKI